MLALVSISANQEYLLELILAFLSTSISTFNRTESTTTKRTIDGCFTGHNELVFISFTATAAICFVTKLLSASIAAEARKIIHLIFALRASAAATTTTRHKWQAEGRRRVHILLNFMASSASSRSNFYWVRGREGRLANAGR